MKMTNEIKKLLAKHLECKVSEIDFDDYVVYTDEEADAMCADYIRESICFFNTSFLMSHAKDNVTGEYFDSLKEHYESANGSIRELIKDFDYLVEDAISQDGRGHFMSTYDGIEIELSLNDGVMVFAYRVN